MNIESVGIISFFTGLGKKIYNSLTGNSDNNPINKPGRDTLLTENEADAMRKQGLDPLNEKDVEKYLQGKKKSHLDERMVERGISQKDILKIKQNGKSFMDSETGYRVYVYKDKAYIEDENGGITVFGDVTKKNLIKRIQEGKWVPE